MKRLGHYQRAVLKGIRREGKMPITISDGYPKQVKSLQKRNLIMRKKDYLFLTSKGKYRINNRK